MAQQGEFLFAAPDDLERFNIPRSTQDIRYGHVSRHLRTLWRSGRRVEAAELALVASDIFKSPGWVKLYPAQRAAA